MQRERIGQFCPITISASDGLREPQEFATTPTGSRDPLTVVPTGSIVGQGPMVLTSTGRTTGSVHPHVNLVDHVDARCQLGNEQTRESRARGRTNDDRHVIGPGDSIELEQIAHVLDVIAGAHHVYTAFDQAASQPTLPRGRGQNNHRRLTRSNVDRAVDGPSLQSPRSCLLKIGSSIVNKNGKGRRRELSSHSSPHNTEAHHRDGRTTHDGGRVSSRQPPRSGGTPPLPRIRNTAAAMPVSVMAAIARRRIFMATI